MDASSKFPQFHIFVSLYSITTVSVDRKTVGSGMEWLNYHHSESAIDSQSNNTIAIFVANSFVYAW